MTENDRGGDAGALPPPGWQPPPPPQPPPYGAPQYGAPQYGAPQYGAAPPGGWAPPPGMPVAAHKPGAMPLRPLGLGDIFDAAFRTIRFNPKATVGSAALVAAVAMAFPVVITAILTATIDLSLDTSASSTGEFDTSSIAGLAGSFGALGLGLILAGFGTIFVTGMIAHVTAAAAVGRRLGLGGAWAATRGQRWRLIGLALTLFLAFVVILGLYTAAWVVVVVAARDSVAVIVVWGLLSVPLFVAFLVWFWVRVYYLPVPVLMLESVGVFASIRRGFTLTRRQFWRTFGIALLTAIVVGIAAQIIGLPVGVVGQVAAVAVDDRYTVLVLVVAQAISQVITLAFTTPFTSAVTCLQYLDQRMRKEAYDVELMQQAGITGQPG